MKNSSPNYWMYLAVVSIIFNLFLAYQLYMQPQTPQPAMEQTIMEETMDAVDTMKEEPDAQLLFIQESSDALLEENEGAYTLTMNDAPSLYYFTDRPYRVAGELDADFFADLLNSQENDPPNAILQLERDDEYANVPVELTSVSLNEDGTLTYALNELAVEETQAYLELSRIGTLEFERATLFIDNFRSVGGRQFNSLVISDGKQDKPTDLNSVDTASSGQATSDLQPGKTLPNLQGSSFPPTADLNSGIGPSWASTQTTSDIN